MNPKTGTMLTIYLPFKRIPNRTWIFLVGLLYLSIEHASAQTPEKRLADMGIELRTPPAPMANYLRAVRTGNLVYLSGHGPSKSDGTLVLGKVGQELTLEQGQQAARLTGIALLTSLKAEIGELSKVKRVVKVLGMVNAGPEFTQHPLVINGFSDLMVAVLGDKGKHARSAIGVASLPSNMAVEIEMIVEIED